VVLWAFVLKMNLLCKVLTLPDECFASYSHGKWAQIMAIFKINTKLSGKGARNLLQSGERSGVESKWFYELLFSKWICFARFLHWQMNALHPTAMATELKLWQFSRSIQSCQGRVWGTCRGVGSDLVLNLNSFMRFCSQNEFAFARFSHWQMNALHPTAMATELKLWQFSRSIQSCQGTVRGNCCGVGSDSVLNPIGFYELLFSKWFLYVERNPLWSFEQLLCGGGGGAFLLHEDTRWQARKEI
jgi:hypothetical protein